MGKAKILIVDDEKIIGRAFEKELGDAGYKVDSALSGETAIEMVKSEKYALVFVDFVLPDMDGVETCRIIKEISPESVLVFMTGKFDKDITRKEVDFQKAGGAIYYLYKPFGAGEILEVTKKILAES